MSTTTRQPPPSPTPGRYRVRVTERRNEALTAGHGNLDYLSPPDTLQQALLLVRLLDGGHADGAGPWREPVAGGTRLIELIQDQEPER